jgi:uncharacterized protein (UPF0276 family)
MTVEIYVETPYPENWLIAGGPCTDRATSWRGGLCLLCNGKLFTQQQDHMDLGWLERFDAMIEKHDMHDCEHGERKPLT